MTDPRIAGLLNRPAQRFGNFEARLKIRERTPSGGLGSTVIIPATLPIGSGTEVTQEDVTAIGVKQVGTDDAELRILPSTSKVAELQLFDGATAKWGVRKETSNEFRIRDLVSASNVLEVPSNSYYSTYRRRLEMNPTTAGDNTGAALVIYGPMNVGVTAPAWRTKMAIAPTSYTGTWENSVRGVGLVLPDQIGDDNTIVGAPATIFAGLRLEAGGATSSTGAAFDKRGCIDNIFTTMQVDEAEPTVAIQSLSSNGGAIRVNATGHGYVTDDVVTIAGSHASAGSGFSNTVTNYTWRIIVDNANAFTLVGSVFVATGTGTSQRHLYGDICGHTNYVYGSRPGGNVQAGEWSAQIALGKWAKAHAIGLALAEKNTYASYNAQNPGATPAPVFNANSFYKQRGSAAATLYAADTGEVGTLLHMANYGNTTPPKRWLAITRDGGVNVQGTDIFGIGAGDADGARMWIGKFAAVNHSTNPAGLSNSGRIVIAPAAEPTGRTDGIQFGKATNNNTDAKDVLLHRSGAGQLKIVDGLNGPGHLWVTGNLDVGVGGSSGHLAVLATDGSGFLWLSEQTSAPTGSPDVAKLYVDDSSGNSRLNVIFWSGATQTIAQEGGIPSWAVGNMTALGGGTAGAVGIYMTSAGRIDCVGSGNAVLRNFTASLDTKETFSLRDTGEYRAGAGGSTAVDVGFERSAANTLTITRGSSGTTGILRCESNNVVGTGGLGFFQWSQQSATPSAPTANTRVRSYFKGTKLVHWLYDGSTNHYNIIELTTGVVSHQTSAP